MDDSQVSGLHGCKESLSDRRDRLSELPNSLILEILSLLPMRDVVTTTLLSKRWKDLWTTVPCLDFSNIPKDNDLYKFRRFVCGALGLWKGVKIRKFSLSTWRYYNSFVSDIYDSWLLFSVEKQVEDLNIYFKKYISVLDFVSTSNDYCVPQFLHSCSSIKKLSLVSCNVKIDKNVQWNQLKSLTIGGGAEPLSDVSLNHILSGAPHLEVLNVCFSLSKENSTINIGSTSLKMLKIHMIGDIYNEADDAMLRIGAPNLDTLEILGSVACRMCVFDLDVPSLTTAILDFRDMYMLLQEILRHVLHVQKLTLSYSCIDQVLLQMKNYREIASNAKFLKLISGSAPIKILGVVEMFPQLTMLVIECNERMPSRPFGDQSDALDTRRSCRLLQYLKIVEITWPLHDPSIYIVIEILLKNAQMLEKMVFRPLTVSSPESMFLAEEKVRSMRRSSPTAELIFINKY